MRLRTSLCACLLAVGSGTSALHADVLVPKSGPKVRGLLVKRTESEIVFNPYWSSNPEMKFEVLRLTPAQVKKVDVEPHPEPEVLRRLQARKPGDVAEAKAIAAWARERKLKAHAEMALAFALVDAPDDAEALAAIGGRARFDALRRGNVLLDPDLVAAVRAYVAEPSAVERVRKAADLKARGLSMKPEELERWRRAWTSPKGHQEDVPLALHADRCSGAVYTLFVPDSYDPAFPSPLLIGLHGGGPDGKDMDEVVGSGPSAMNFYRDLASERGVIVACPTALVASWGRKVNEELVRDVVAEVRLLYNVDVDRIHLTGHSMGGYGTWDLGPKMAELFATISPMAGAGDGDVSKLIETRTPIFIYHSEDDFIAVAPDRMAAKKLRESDLDFVYTELQREGHGLPESVRRELFDFLLPRRNADPASKDVWPRSSLLGKATTDEKAYFGDPMSDLEGKTLALDDHLARMRLGGGCARGATAALAASKPAGVVEGAIKVLKDEKAPPYGRAEAARLLGTLGDGAAAPALRRVVAADARRETSGLAAASARALAALKDAGAAGSLEDGVVAWSAYFEKKRMGATMRFSDWERSLSTLSAITSAWADLGGGGAPDVLDRTVVAKVFSGAPKVETSERVPQDPSRARTELARAVARAYAAAKAPAAKWDALFVSVEGDAASKAAVAEERK